MSIDTETTKQLYKKFLANFEAKLNQNSPLNDKSFLKVLATNQAGTVRQIINLSIQKAAANLVKTAFGDDLKELGESHDEIFRDAEAATLNISLPAVDATVIQQNVVYTGDSNGIQYRPNNQAVAVGGVAEQQVVADVRGDEGNLGDGETLTINTQIPGAETVATVDSTEKFGINEENEEDYRARVRLAIFRRLGGYSPADNRKFAEQTQGVIRGYPFTGRPGIVGSVPIERTVFIEADPLINPDGIAPPALLDAARDSLTVDPDTGFSRLPLGITAEYLYVESITRILIYVTITGLITPPGQETTVQSAIEQAVADYLFNIKMRVPGLDPEDSTEHIISDPSLSKVVQDVVEVNNSSIVGVAFGLDPFTFEGLYALFPGELAKLTTPITYQ